MFSLQVGKLGKLRQLGMPDAAVRHLQDTLANCSQALEHRGPITLSGDLTQNGDTIFEGDVEFSNTNLMKWAKATADWTNASGNGSYVECRKASNRTGTLAAGTVRVYLPRAGGQDPNVREDDVIGYMLDLNGAAVCITDYLDDKIGMVKMWAGVEGSIPAGWTILTTVGGTNISTGTHARHIVPYVAGLANYDSLGASGGTATHTHDAHTISNHTISAHIASSSSVVVTGSNSSTVVTGSNSSTSTNWSGYTEYATTGITVSDHTTSSESVSQGTGSTVSVDCMDLTHTVVEPNSSTGHRHAVTVSPGSHTHTFTADTHTHTFTANSHSHTVSVDDHSALTHSGSLTHAETNHINPYVAIYYIQRTS